MKSYQLASDFWGGPLCVIRDSGHRGDRIATVPIEFLRQSGDNTWRYIYRVIAELVSEDDLLGAVISDGRGLTVDPGEEPTAGVFIFRRNGGPALHSLVGWYWETDKQVLHPPSLFRQAHNIFLRSKHQIQRAVIPPVLIPSDPA